MKQWTAILSLMFISSTVFGASDRCTQTLRSLLLHTAEASRLSSAAIEKGYDIETDSVHEKNHERKLAQRLMQLSLTSSEKAEELELKLTQECLK